jgi:hypothetical protein
MEIDATSRSRALLVSEMAISQANQCHAPYSCNLRRLSSLRAFCSLPPSADFMSTLGGGAMDTTLHVGNLPASATESDLTSRFEQFGTVESASISRDSNTGMSKGFGQVRMASAIEAPTAIAQLNLTQQDGLTMIVSKARVDLGDSP